jgi:hypothetical protein
MEVKPSKGLKVVVNAQREAIFGDESVSVQKINLEDGNRTGTMTGQVLAGYGEIEMQRLDGKKHWYPIDDLAGENGEKIVEEQISVEVPDDDGTEEEL